MTNPNTQNPNQPSKLKQILRGAAAVAALTTVAAIGAPGIGGGSPEKNTIAPQEQTTTTTEAPLATTESTTTTTIEAPTELVPPAYMEIGPNGELTESNIPNDTVVIDTPQTFNQPSQVPGEPGVAGSATSITRG